MEEVPEDPSPKEHDADKAIDLMRFVFKEGLAFLDNGSGRCLTERMLVDMGGFMVNKMLEQPAVAQRNAPCRMRMFKSSTFETEMSHAFAKEARKGIAEELQGDFFGKGEVVERLLGIVPDPDISGPSLKEAVHSMLSEAGSPQFTEKLCTLIKERGVNLDNDLRKPGETNWGSYHEAIMKFAAYFIPLCDALEFVEEQVSRGDAKHMVWKINQGMDYDFFFGLLLMQDILSVTNELSLALDREGWGVENCVALLQEATKQLQRSEGAEATRKTYLEHHHLDFFQKVINKQLEELERRFTKESSELVLLATYLNPRNSFQGFDKDKLVKFARFYPSEFSDSDTATLELQLQAFITDVRSDNRFLGMDTLNSLYVKMVETGKNTAYPLVYLLLKLALILPGTPATVKSASIAMKFIENTVRKEPCNQWISDCLLLFLEPDIFENITNDAVLESGYWV
ncbi:hypothetical protein BRADI_1g61880v3 [Brachypodium distachyon]|uniref:HAT C-terminal dimerisation domain-containing protein n=1 Tax=Brachypodium distachyon TaxID=15368 RepID=A0A0Q3S9E7_BRADI|nr:hypothetical protein BRADI_1g61880v3 [Brachypodium distachyon]